MSKLLSNDLPDIASIRDGAQVSIEGGDSSSTLPDISSIRGDMSEYDDLPKMSAQDPDMLTKASDFISDVGDQIKYNDSMSSVQNLWRGLFNSVKQAVPEFDEQGNFLGTRSETEEERRERVNFSTEENRSKLHDNIAAEITAKGFEIVSDPLTWLPIGRSYKSAAVIGGAVTATDMAAYNLAEDGVIHPNDVAIAAAFGVVLGPAIKYVGEKVVSMYKGFRTEGASHKEAMDSSIPSEDILKMLPPPEKLKALPAPEILKALPAPTATKLLPSPGKVGAPYFVNSKGNFKATPNQGEGSTTIIEGSGKLSRKEVEKEAAWQQKSLNEWMKKEEDISKAWSKDYAGVTVESVKKAVKSNKLSLKTEGEILSDSIHPNSAMVTAFDKAVKNQEEGIDLLKNHMGQGGSLSQSLSHHMASTSVGAAIGGYVDGSEGALYGGMLGMGMPLAFRHTAKTIGKIKDWSHRDTATVLANAHIWSSPTAVIKGFGVAGRNLADRLSRTLENIDLKVADRLWHFEKKVGHLSSSEMDDVRKLLNHTLKPSQSSPKIVAAAKQMRREFNRVIDDAVEVGVITREKGAKMKIKASKDGYFPRVYDKELLSTKAGKDAWVEAWTKVDLSSKSMRDTLYSIIGDKDVVASFLKASSVGKNGKNQMSHSQALDLLRMMMNKSHHARSSHLEHSRGISERFEGLLEPFLIKDPSAVVARYYNDSYRRIEASRMFDGVNSKGVLTQDIHADALFDRISRERSLKEAELARQTYYTVIGDSNSDIIRASMKMGDNQRRFLQGMSSFETATKLSTAQMLNMMQATVNGITLLSGKNNNPFTTLKLFSKGFKKAISKEGGEFAQRTGAALETTLMEIAGESSHIGKYGERVLKYSGFISAEKIQRRLGANIGRAYAESLLDKFAKVQSGKISGAKAKKIIKQMGEMGLPTQRAATDTDLYRAGLRFSNEINFRNTPDKIPLGWQTPYGRLLTKFKTFAFHQSRFIKDNVIKPLLKGNPQPLIWYAGGASSIGMGIDELRRLVKGDDRDFSGVERYLRGITSIGGMGLIQDLVTSGSSSQGGFAAALAGPAISDMGRTLIALKKLGIDQDPRAALDEMQRIFVLPGKGYIVDELAIEGSSRGVNRSSNRSSSRSSGGR